MNDEIQNALSAWYDAKMQFEALQKRERELRVLCVEMMRGDSAAGFTQTFELDENFEAKFKIPINYNFVKNGNKTDNAAVESALNEIRQSENGELIAERLVAWKPNLSVTEYKRLTHNAKQAIDRVLVTSEGLPTLEIKPKKG